MNKEDLKTGRVLVDFYADWCGPCKVYAKSWDKVTSELTDIVFENVNNEKDTTGMAAKYKVTSIPHTVVVKEGTTNAKTGRLSAEELKNLI